MSAAATDSSPPPTAPSAAGRPSIVARLLMGLVWLYQRTVVMRSPRCRFRPTCSAYALESIRVHGALRGTGHALARLARCHPWNPGGIDPVTPANSRKSDS